LRLSYSTLVRGLTIVLPLVALALLSTIFLVARSTPQDSSLPFVREFRDRGPLEQDEVRAPFYTGATQEGDAVTVRADRLRPEIGAPENARAERIRADIDFLDGTSLQIVSDTGFFDAGENELRLDGNVILRTSNGYDLYTPDMVADLSRREARGSSDVRIEGPAGTIDAGAFAIRRAGDDDLEVFFTNRVKVIYLPPRSAE